MYIVVFGDDLNMATVITASKRLIESSQNAGVNDTKVENRTVQTAAVAAAVTLAVQLAVKGLLTSSHDIAGVDDDHFIASVAAGTAFAATIPDLRAPGYTTLGRIVAEAAAFHARPMKLPSDFKFADARASMAIGYYARRALRYYALRYASGSADDLLAP